jgi:hypothetical protein
MSCAMSLARIQAHGASRDGGPGHRGAGPGGAVVGVDATGETGPGCGTSPDSPVLAAAHRLAETRGQRVAGHRDHRRDRPGHNRLPDPGALGLRDQAVQVRRPVRHVVQQGQADFMSGDSYTRAAAGQADLGVAGTATFARRPVPAYRPPPRQGHRPGRRRPLHHDRRLAPAVRPRRPRSRLGPDFYTSRINRDKKIRTHIQVLKALGVTVTITDDEHAA